VASRLVAAGGFAALVVAVPGRAEEPPAQPGAVPWRVVVGPSLVLPASETTYASTYSPPFPYVPHTSDATQRMPLDADAGPGLLVGIERSIGPRVGLQLSAHYGEADLSGSPGGDLRMRYTSPPALVRAGGVTLSARAQPAAEGRLKTLAVALDLVA
jgi:hypothetical protein